MSLMTYYKSSVNVIARMKGCCNPACLPAQQQQLMEEPVFKTDDIALLAVVIKFWFLDGLFYYLHLI